MRPNQIPWNADELIKGLRKYLVDVFDWKLSQLVSFFEYELYCANINGRILLESIQNEFKKTIDTDKLRDHVHQLLQYSITALDLLKLETVYIRDLLAIE